MKRMLIPAGFAAVYLIFFLSCSKEKSAQPNNPTVPVLTTAAISAITQTTAQCGGTVTSDGGANVYYRGVCWSTNPTPTYSDMKTYNGTGTGTFTSSLTGLIRTTHYYVRAYAMNDAGLGYGSVDSFATTDSMGTVMDIDDNAYATIKIGTQWWMAENLKVTHYRNGNEIDHVTNDSIWGNVYVGAYCDYNNDTANVATYGRLYNWYAVYDTSILAPDGWHVPSDDEWQTLVDYLGGDTRAGVKMKETGIAHWNGLNAGATNENGFTALPGGYRFDNGDYLQMGNFAYFWSSTPLGSSEALLRYLYYDDSEVHHSIGYRRYGFSIRCVKD
jgi:uncharacterized protein (TIGR02145 family)